MPDELAVLHFENRAALAVWMSEHAADSPGIWLRLAKKGSAVSSVTYAEVIELGLCHGWIDGQKRALDERFWLQRFTPRTATSRWSRINRDKATELLTSTEMTPAGIGAIERAKADGRWDRAYEGASTIGVPDDLQRALDASPEAAAFFATLDGQNRYAVLYRVGDCKKPETRARRIETFVAMLARGEKLHP
jgi:uncharacterized protein YdeI (YjbR/CyaY-like superfamily)